MPEINLPYAFDPRLYQLELLKAMDSGYKRAVAVWHRRAGKDLTLINLLTKRAFERVGIYYYLFPTAAWGRRILWHGMDRDGVPFLDHVPEILRKKTREDEMRIELVNGSSIQIVGTDNLTVVGPNPVGCVFSEYSLQNPKAWDLIRPILAENGGWAIFNFTPKGRNHGWDIYQMALNNPEWFVQLLTVEDTGAISLEAVDEERKAGMSEQLISQEFYSSFDYGLEGAYYLNEINRAREENRITNIPIEDLPVHTAWDLGIGDSTSIWFFQLVAQEVRLIDYYENSGEGLAHYAKVLQGKGYLYGTYYAPHDIEKRELGTGISLRQRARELGINFNRIPKHTIEDGIEALRSIFPRLWFDEKRTKEGLNALMNYQKEWDNKHQVFKTHPLHNWASHGSDAARYMAVAVKCMSTGGNTMSEQEAQRLYEQYAPPV